MEITILVTKNITKHEGQQANSRRKYPEIYEKMVPLALGLITLVVAALIIITVGIALGLWANPGH